MKFLGHSNKNLHGGEVNSADSPVNDTEKTIGTSNRDDTGSSDEDLPSKDVQAGIKKVEAVTLTWTKTELYLAYFW